jgi:DNA (cytosine-5)-methyltransferase 1
VKTYKNGMLPIIDLFAGPGGLGEGFSALQLSEGNYPFRVRLSIEKDPVAHQTLELRAFFRSFPRSDVPPSYYQFMRGEIARDELLRAYPAQANLARAETWCKELAIESHAEVAARIREILSPREESILICGPPSQAYSLVGRARNAGNPFYRPLEDKRHTLYQEYLRVLSTQLPCIFVMENVKGLLSARYDDQGILNQILDDLRDPLKALGARVRTKVTERYQVVAFGEEAEQHDAFGEVRNDVGRFVVRAENHGIPQRRHRVIIIGIREDMLSTKTLTLRKQQLRTTAQVLDDLPPLRSALSNGDDSTDNWLDGLSGVCTQAWFLKVKSDQDPVAIAIEAAIATAFDRRGDRGGEYVAGQSSPGIEKAWFKDKRVRGFANHASRSHIAEDLARYLFASAFALVRGRSPTLADFPRQLLPKHKNVEDALEGGLFADRFRVQLADQPSTTITSHIAKDGHYYIHYDPSQCRSLTVREAARLQTFPDNYFFCGPRTAQYLQVGNAVPPLLARQIAAAISDYLG